MSDAAASPSLARRGLWEGAAIAAIALPTLIAFHVAPSATFFNEDAAFIGWGCLLLAIGSAVPRGVWPRSRASVAALLAFVILLAAVFGSAVWFSNPWSLSLSAAASLAGAMLALSIAGAAMRAGLGNDVFRVCCIALVVAGVGNSLVALLQMFLPTVPDGQWIATLATRGRAAGNLRQPNQLATLMVWSLIAVAWLHERRVLRRGLTVALGTLFVFIVVLTGSRAGALALLILPAWGLLDRRLAKPTRWMLWLAPFVYALLWLAMALWARHSQLPFAGEARLGADGSSRVRLEIWSQAMVLIAQHPWLGVGFGQFNFAWVLTPTSTKSEIFDHTHNLVLNLAVELGIPVASLVLSLLAFGLLCSWRRAPRAEDGGWRSVRHAAWAMLAIVTIHSLLEYPLWYPHFLLPTALLLGLCLEWPRAEDIGRASIRDANAVRPFALVAIAMLLGGVYAYNDYRRVADVFAPAARAVPFELRLAAGRRSVLFSHYADEATATSAADPAAVMRWYARASHFVLDPRLMMAWSRALAERGDVDKARYVAQRLREFHDPTTREFFADCPDNSDAEATAARGTPPRNGPSAELPFQCLAPGKQLTLEDFR